MKEALKSGKCQVFASGFEGFTEQQITGSMIGDGEGITVLLVSQPELALVIGAPEIVGLLTWRTTAFLARERVHGAFV